MPKEIYIGGHNHKDLYPKFKNCDVTILDKLEFNKNNFNSIDIFITAKSVEKVKQIGTFSDSDKLIILTDESVKLIGKMYDYYEDFNLPQQISVSIIFDNILYSFVTIDSLMMCLMENNVIYIDENWEYEHYDIWNVDDFISESAYYDINFVKDFSTVMKSGSKNKKYALI